jgi:hypothetical protein
MQKNAIVQKHLVVDGDMTGTITSEAINILRMDRASLQLVFTGTPTGDFAVEVSGDYREDQAGNPTNTGTWTPITLSPAPVAAGSADDIFIDLTVTAAPWVRLTYTPSAGTGTLNAHLSAKAA